MKQRKLGCICELDEKTGEPIVANYAMCPVHKPDALDPKKEAERLINEFSLTVDGAVSRECAMIAVDEILNIIDGFWHYEAEATVVFYKRVKEEIQSL